MITPEPTPTRAEIFIRPRLPRCRRPRLVPHLHSRSLTMQNIIDHIENVLGCSCIRYAVGNDSRFSLYTNEKGYVMVVEYLSRGKVIGGDVLSEVLPGSNNTADIIAALDQQLGSCASRDQLMANLAHRFGDALESISELAQGDWSDKYRDESMASDMAAIADAALVDCEVVS